MKTPIRTLTPEEFPAIMAAAWLHGRKFKSVILECWQTGGYRKNMLEDHDGTLQRMRNSPDGHAVLESLRTRDFVASPTVAFLMGANCARGEGPANPFGVAALADAWRRGYASVKNA